MIILNKMVLLCLSLLAVGCSGGRNPDKEAESSAAKTARIANLDFEVLSNSNLVFTTNGAANQAVGSGTLQAREALPDVAIGRHFTIRGRLSEGGSIRLIAFASRDGSALKNGFEIELSQTTGLPGLQVFATASGSTDNWSNFFSTIDSLAEFDLGFDIHNDENGEAHVLVWNLMDPANQEAIFDSSKDVRGSPGKGFGRIWGIQLKDASVQSVNLGEVRYDH